MHLKVSPTQKLPHGATFMPVLELAFIALSRELVHTIRFLELPRSASFASVLGLNLTAPLREHVRKIRSLGPVKCHMVRPHLSSQYRSYFATERACTYLLISWACEPPHGVTIISVLKLALTAPLIERARTRRHSCLNRV
jgi:hypothetical protein